MFNRYDTIHDRDRRADRWTKDRHLSTANTALMHIIARVKIKINGVAQRGNVQKCPGHNVRT